MSFSVVGLLSGSERPLSNVVKVARTIESYFGNVQRTRRDPDKESRKVSELYHVYI